MSEANRRLHNADPSTSSELDNEIVSVADEPGPDTTAEVLRVVPAIQTVEGAGFIVTRPFPTASLNFVDPFLLFDQLGPAEFGPGEGIGTDWHPHRGFETVTYVLEGENRHEDNKGGHGLIGPGDTQWMTAGAGVLHKEGPSDAIQRTGGRSHGLQLWVNLPAAHKAMAPRYQNIRRDDVATRLDMTDEGHAVLIRVIAGELFGLQGPGQTVTPISYAHLTFPSISNASVTTPLPAGHNVLVYPLTGSVRIAGSDIATSHLALIGAGNTLTIENVAGQRERPAEVIVLTGLPIGEPVVRSGPFVMNTEAEIQQAFVDFQSGGFGQH